MGTNTGLENDRHRYNNYWDSHTSFTSVSLSKKNITIGAFFHSWFFLSSNSSFLKARGRELSTMQTYTDVQSVGAR